MLGIFLTRLPGVDGSHTLSLRFYSPTLPIYMVYPIYIICSAGMP
jgi:hypothetical protein